MRGSGQRGRGEPNMSKERLRLCLIHFSGLAQAFVVLACESEGQELAILLQSPLQQAQGCGIKGFIPTSVLQGNLFFRIWGVSLWEALVVSQIRGVHFPQP